MNGRTAYPGALPQDIDVLVPQRNAVYALGRMLADILQNTVDPSNILNPTLVAGFKPTFPGGLSVALGQGSIYKLTDADTAWGTLSSDTRQVIQQGLANAQTLTFAAPPGTVGHSRIDLVQVKHEVINDGGVVLQYYNSANPAQPLNGPSGLGTVQAVDHRNAATVEIKQGTSGASPSAPTADAGYVPLFEVTIANGLVNIISGNLAVSATAPFIAGLTTQHHTGAPGGAPKINILTEVSGYNIGDALPAADSTRRGHTFVLRGGSGVPDKVYYCLKLGDDTYDWAQTA